MKPRGRNERLRTAYKKAFEESFVDNFNGWEQTLSDVNGSIKAINKEEKKECRTYSYDEFCCLAKCVVDLHLEQVDWGKMIDEEERLSNHHVAKGFRARAMKKVAVMETEVLFKCFEQAILKSIGSRLYKKYRDEIEQFKEEEVIL